MNPRRRRVQRARRYKRKVEASGVRRLLSWRAVYWIYKQLGLVLPDGRMLPLSRASVLRMGRVVSSDAHSIKIRLEKPI